MSMQRIRNLTLALLLAAGQAVVLPMPAAAHQAPAAGSIERGPAIMQAAAEMAARPSQASVDTFAAAKPAVNRSIALAAPSGLRREVFGFVNAGNLGDPTFGFASWNFSLLSTVAYFGLQINGADGSIVQGN